MVLKAQAVILWTARTTVLTGSGSDPVDCKDDGPQAQAAIPWTARTTVLTGSGSDPVDR